MWLPPTSYTRTQGLAADCTFTSSLVTQSLYAERALRGCEVEPRRPVREAELSAAGELAGFGVDVDFFPFFDEEGDADLEAGFKAGVLGDCSAGGVAANARLG